MMPGQRRPQEGDEVWCRGVLDMVYHQAIPAPFRVRFTSGIAAWHPASDITTTPPTSPASRPEWEVWRDVAKWLRTRGWNVPPNDLEAEAARMEAAARPVPVPTMRDALIAAADALTCGALDDKQRALVVRDIRAALAREEGA